MKWTCTGLVMAAVLGAAAGVCAEEAAVTIEPVAVACVVAGSFPRIEARVRPHDQVAQARFLFRPAGTQGWYSAPMSTELDTFVAFLPKPKKDLASIEYVVEVTDQKAATSRSAMRSVKVVAKADACDGEVAPRLSFSATMIEPPPEGPPEPPGFESAGAPPSTQVGVFPKLGAGVGLVAGGVLAAGAAVAISSAASEPTGTAPSNTTSVEFVESTPAVGARLSSTDTASYRATLRYTAGAVARNVRVDYELTLGSLTCLFTAIPSLPTTANAAQDIVVTGPLESTGRCGTEYQTTTIIATVTTIADGVGTFEQARRQIFASYAVGP